MTRFLCVALLVASAAPAIAAQRQPSDPTVALYQSVLERLTAQPDSPVALAALQIPSKPGDAAQRRAFDAIVSLLEEAARQKPQSFEIAYNLYVALWKRHLYFGDDADAKRAFAQLDAAEKLAEPQSEEKTRAVFERAANLLAVKKSLAEEIVGGDVREEAARLFIEAKLRAMSRGTYARRSALALADLAIERGETEKARSYLREALELDPKRGYTTNRAYDRLGVLLLDAGKVDEAVVMLESAGNVVFDDDLKTNGYAWALARRLIDARGLADYTKPVEYLRKAYETATEQNGTVSPDFLYALALGCEKARNLDLALLYWEHYLKLNDPKTEQRLEGERRAKALLARTVRGAGG